MIFRTIFTLLICQAAFLSCCGLNDLIWDKCQRKFVNLYSIPAYAVLRKKVQEEVDSAEIYDFMGKQIKIGYYEEKNLMVYYDNDRKVTGILGDVWTLLSDYLNFTLVPVKYNKRSFGSRLANGSFTGLLGLLTRNEIHVIVRSGLFLFRANTLKYTIPLWRTRYRLYIKPEYEHDSKWMLTLFSEQTWYMILIVFVILSISGYILQKISQKENIQQHFTRIKKKQVDVNYSLSDHIFYTFALVCAQGYIPTGFYNKYKILSLSKTVFCWLIFLTFSSHLIYRMTNRIMLPPFSDLETLMNSTKYNLLAFSGSMVQESFVKNLQKTPSSDNNVNNRVRYVATPWDMYRRLCYSPKLYAMFEVEDRHMANSRSMCTMIHVGRAYYETWIGAAVLRSFEHKKPIDTAIVKMHEVGLIDGLRDRWLDTRMDAQARNSFTTIDIKQVKLIFMMLCLGAWVSIVMLAFENFFFYYTNKLSCTTINTQ
ncbi:hypothetical protein KM043_001301 [Ampulex compressa]|nr:hypothetical protein KM043_001301 [Ampulex compressa]